MALAVTNNFVSGTTAVADDVDQNFTDIVNYVNTNAIIKDGTLAFTGVPSGPATDPTSANQFTRKQYVDDRVGLQSSYSSGQSHTIVAFDTYETITTLTITNPGKAVVVAAWGNIRQACGNGAGLYSSRVGISLDNGSSYTYGTEMAEHIAASQQSCLAPFHYRAGTPSADIKVIVQHFQATAVSTKGQATDASLMYQMWKTVTV